MSEAKAFGRSWWCQGGGGAVLALLATVTLFRDARDAIFWAAIAFFVGHLLVTVWRYRSDRRVITTAVVTRHHDARRDESARPSPRPQLKFASASASTKNIL